MNERQAGTMYSKLFLKAKMDPSYLIQRLKKPIGHSNLFAFGGGLRNGGLSPEAADIVKSIFSFDYMGAAEFEWGAVQAALKFLAEQAAKNNIFAAKLAVAGGVVFYLTPLEYAGETERRIEKLRLGEGTTKEWVGLNQWFDSKAKWSQEVCGWLELDNGYAFFTDENMFQEVCRLFGVDSGVVV